MRRFKKKPELAFVVIPGVGRINDDRVLEGDQFAKFAPSVLVEVLPSAPAPAPKAPPAVLVDSPPPVTAPAPVSTPASAPAPAPAPAPVTLNEAFPTEAELKAAVERENKATEEQIDTAVERLAPVEEKKAEVKKPAPKPQMVKKPSGRK